MKQHNGKDTVVNFYASILNELRELARPMGYCLAVHGSMIRDLDIVAIPWIDDAVSGYQLAEAIRQQVDGTFSGPAAKKPHGRLAWSIVCGGMSTYIDLSVVPRMAAS